MLSAQKNTHSHSLHFVELAKSQCYNLPNSPKSSQFPGKCKLPHDRQTSQSLQHQWQSHLGTPGPRGDTLCTVQVPSHRSALFLWFDYLRITSNFSWSDSLCVPKSLRLEHGSQNQSARQEGWNSPTDRTRAGKGTGSHGGISAGNTGVAVSKKHKQFTMHWDSTFKAEIWVIFFYILCMRIISNFENKVFINMSRSTILRLYSSNLHKMQKTL